MGLWFRDFAGFGGLKGQGPVLASVSVGHFADQEPELRLRSNPK